MFKKYLIFNFLIIQKLFLILIYPIKIIFYIIYLLHRKPFSYGYNFHKWKVINKNLLSKNIINSEYLDERLIEYNWLFNNLKKFQKSKNKKLLDAGSTINFNLILKYLNKNFKIFIQTLYPEPYSEYYNGVSYIYSDLRESCFKKNYFDIITCISTLEHIGLKNDEYDFFNTKKSKVNKIIRNKIKVKYNIYRDDIKVIKEFKRILKKNGSLLLTIPYGKKNILKTLRQYDDNMVSEILKTFNGKVKDISYATYKNKKWNYCKKEDCVIKNFGEQIINNEIISSARSVVMLNLEKK